MERTKGNIVFDRKPAVISYASVVGDKESEGPLRDSFDLVVHDSYAGKDTFEQAESELMYTAANIALTKGGVEPHDIDIAFCGDLLNQCVASSFAMRPFNMPYAGIYGACSTMALSLIMGAIAVGSGAAERTLCGASSHYCTAERQYRFPLEYGAQRPPTAQRTVTGAGVCILGSDGANPATAPYIANVRIGRIVDYGISDQNNMGAAMAPAIVKLGTIFFR